MKRIFTLLFLGLTLGALAMPVAAQVRPLRLTDAVKVALEQNRDLKVARLDEQSTGQQVREAWGGIMPTISASASFIHNFQTAQFLPGQFFGAPGNNFVPLIFNDINIGNAGISIQMPLFQGAVYAALRSSSTVDKLSKETLIGTKATVVSDVKKAYYNVLIVQEQFKLQQQSLARNTDALNDTRNLFRQGLAADIDTLRAFIAVENLRPALIKTQASIEVAKLLLKTKLGVPESEQVELLDTLYYDGQSLALPETEAYSEAVAMRPEIKQLELNVALGDENIAVEFAGHLPTLSAVGEFKVSTQASDFRFSQYAWPVSSYAGLQLSLPLFNGFKTDSKVQRAVIAKQRTETQLDNTKQLIRAEIKTSISNFEVAKRQIEVQQQTVATAERSYSITRSRRKQGVGSQLELTDAELSLNQAKTNYLQSIYDYLTAKVDLEKALGRTGRIEYGEQK